MHVTERTKHIARFALLSLMGMCYMNTPAQSQSKKPVRNASVETPLTSFTWQDVTGKRYDQSILTDSKATVFLFSSTQCPIANSYTPRMIELGKEYQAKGVRFFLVNSNREDTLEALRRYAKERVFPFPAVKDDGTQLADILNASHTPEAVIVDAKSIVRYRGRIDDNPDRAKVVRQDVREALDAILVGKPVVNGRTLPFGCTIFRDTVKSVTTKLAKVTYTRDIASILNENCVTCHRAGEAAPFELKTYQQAKTWASAIKDYTLRRAMPPWKAVPGIGDFHDARVLTETQLAKIAQWADSGAPEGDPKDLPQMPDFPKDGWQLGIPTDGGIYRSDAAYSVHSEGKDVYRQFVLPVDTSQDRYIKGFEFRPDNRAIVHHMIVFFDLSGVSVDLDKADPEPGYSVASGDGGIGVPFDKSVWVSGWAPGNSPRFLPEGCAFKMPKGAKVVLQVHYHPNGTPEQDRSAVAFHYAEESKVQKIAITGMVINFTFDFKPGLANQKVTASHPISHDTEIIAVSPHMHMLGREMKLTATLPDGSRQPLVYINDWDFNWQETYRYKKPIRLPKGSKIDLFASYDNSEKNPRQPSHPPVPVRWGEATTDEMCIGFYIYTMDKNLLKRAPTQSEQAIGTD